MFTLASRSTFMYTEGQSSLSSTEAVRIASCVPSSGPQELAPQPFKCGDRPGLGGTSASYNEARCYSIGSGPIKGKRLHIATRHSLSPLLTHTKSLYSFKDHASPGLTSTWVTDAHPPSGDTKRQADGGQPLRAKNIISTIVPNSNIIFVVEVAILQRFGVYPTRAFGDEIASFRSQKSEAAPSCPGLYRHTFSPSI